MAVTNLDNDLNQLYDTWRGARRDVVRRAANPLVRGDEVMYGYGGRETVLTPQQKLQLRMQLEGDLAKQYQWRTGLGHEARLEQFRQRQQNYRDEIAAAERQRATNQQAAEAAAKLGYQKYTAELDRLYADMETLLVPDEVSARDAAHIAAATRSRYDNAALRWAAMQSEQYRLETGEEPSEDLVARWAQEALTSPSTRNQIARDLADEWVRLTEDKDAGQSLATLRAAAEGAGITLDELLENPRAKVLGIPEAVAAWQLEVEQDEVLISNNIDQTERILEATIKKTYGGTDKVNQPGDVLTPPPPLQGQPAAGAAGKGPTGAATGATGASGGGQGVGPTPVSETAPAALEGLTPAGTQVMSGGEVYTLPMTLSTDPEERSFQTLDLILQQPEMPPVAEAKQAITSSAEFQKWARDRGYTTASSDMQFRLFRQEMRRRRRLGNQQARRSYQRNVAAGVVPNQAGRFTPADVAALEYRPDPVNSARPQKRYAPLTSYPLPRDNMDDLPDGYRP